MLRINPLLARLFPRLAYQLVPAAIVTTVGILVLSSLSRTPDTLNETAPADIAINAEAVFKIVPREVAAEPEQEKKAAARAAGAPKPVAANTVPPQSRRPVNAQVAAAPVPPPIVIAPEQPQAAPVQPADSENTVMSRLFSATAAVQQIPQRAARSVVG